LFQDLLFHNHGNKAKYFTELLQKSLLKLFWSHQLAFNNLKDTIRLFQQSLLDPDPFLSLSKIILCSKYKLYPTHGVFYSILSVRYLKLIHEESHIFFEDKILRSFLYLVFLLMLARLIMFVAWVADSSHSPWVWLIVIQKVDFLLLDLHSP
jgi:hypothetical protein